KRIEQPFPAVLQPSLLMNWHFLQEPRVAIGVAEVHIVMPQFVNHAHYNVPARERFAGLGNVRYDQMRPFDRP
ncbi:MAG TPA: hypothetical protein VF844_00910, partial [Ktedonobacteraceae bacterium]